MRAAAKNPDERWILDAISEAEDRLFEKIDFYAEKNGMNSEDVISLLDRAYETDLSEKYANWVEEGEDTSPTVQIAGVHWPIHEFVAKQHVDDGVCQRCGAHRQHAVHGGVS